MKLSAWSKRLLAGVCTAALLAGGASALALSPAALPTPEALSVTNASDAQLRAALSKLAVVYSSDTHGWQVSSPYEDASLSSASCGLYPYLFLSQDDATVSLTLGMSCFSTQKMELQSIRVETKDSTYNFTCDDQYDGGYDADLKSWFDFEFFAMDDHAEYLTEWAAAKSVTATFTGKDGSTRAYTLTKDNLQAIRDIMAAYTTLLDSDASTAQSVLSSLAK